MHKRSKIILALFGVALVGIIIAEVVRPRPLNWSFNFTAESKLPFGCYVLYQELPKLFPNNQIRKVDGVLYEELAKRDTTKAANYLFLNDIVSLDKQETNALLDHVKKGNNVFIGATSLSYPLLDTLNIRVASEYTVSEDTVQLSLTNTSFKKTLYPMQRGLYNSHFVSVDSSQTTILGHISYWQRNNYTQVKERQVTHPNFIKTKFGKGYFYVNTTPQAYTNYYLLKGNQNYLSQTFAYLNNAPLVWDNYNKSGRVVINSPLRFVLNQAPLKWAYYLSIAGLLLFAVFKAKREQRIIPIIKPNQNDSIAFTQSVGALYYQRKNFTDLINKKLTYFFAYLRSNYYINTNVLDQKTAIQLATKAGKSKQEVIALFDYIHFLQQQENHNETNLITLTKKINAFKP